MGKTKNKWKVSYKEISTNTAQEIQHKHISLLSQIELSKKIQEGVDARGKKRTYIFKAKERKQYQNNGTENLFVSHYVFNRIRLSNYWANF